MPNDINFGGSGYVNSHGGQYAIGAGWDDILPAAFTNLADKYTLSQANMDYNTAATYYVYSGRMHVTDASAGIDAHAMDGFYDRFITTTDLLDRMPDIGMYYFPFRVINEDGSGMYAKLTFTERVYTGAQQDILQYAKFSFERGYFTDYTDSTTYSSYGSDTIAMYCKEYWNIDGRVYLGQAYTPMGESGFPVIYCAFCAVNPTDITPEQSASVIYPSVSNLPFSFSQEWHPEEGWYGRPQDDTSSTGAFYGGSHIMITGVGCSVFNDSKLCRDRSTSIQPLEFSPEAGPASEPDGMNNPSFDDSSDTIDLPDAPEIGVSNVGFVNVYRTGSQSLQNLGLELFPPLQYSVPPAISSGSVTDAIVDGVNNLMTWLANIPSFFEQITAATLINYIIDCHVIPVTPDAGTPDYIHVGNKQLTIKAGKVTSDYKDIDCGTISLAEYYENFADFLTSFKLYLPFVGFVPARPEWFYREKLNIVYRFNIIDGSFVAFVRSTGKYVNNNNSGKTVVGQYGGNACVHLPITGVTYASMVSGLVGAGAGAVAGAGSGNIAAAATSAISAAGVHGDIAQSNAYSSSVAFLGVRRPFVLIERPVSNYSASYQKENGIPSNVTRKLGKVTGFSVIGNVHLDGINATDQEKLEIEKLLHEGVIF